MRADRNATLAREEADRAEGVSEFLDQMLRAADPVGGGGTETTVREVLDAASTEVANGALEGRPLVEISEVMDIRVNAVKHAIFRAVQKLRAELGPLTRGHYETA